MKIKNSNALVIAFPNLKQSFEIKTDASDYTMGVILLHGRHMVFYHSKIFNSAVINYLNYDIKLFSLFKVLKSKNIIWWVKRQ